jgi:restriction modification system DNA specificity domain protein
MNQKWNYVPFEDAVEIWDIKRKPINNAERASRINGKSNNELYPYYGATGQVGFIDDYLTDGEYVLLGEDGAPFLNPIAQKAYIVAGKTWVNNHAHVLKSKYNNKFLCYYLNSINYKDYVSGTTRLKLTQAQMKRILIPVPSIEEQERIVAKIEELFSELDNAVETLNATKVQIEVYKQTVLYEAFSNLSDTVDMQEIATMIDPQPSHRTPPEIVGGIPYIGIGDIDYDNNIIKFDSARKVSASVLAEHLSRYTISKGDFVMGKIGTIGKPYRIPIPQEYALSANVILIQPNHELILPDFLYWQFSSHHVTSQLLKGANATSQPAFGIKKSRLLKIKICDFEQQRAINLDIESKISVYESIAHTVEKSLEEASAMRQSILKQAFEGRLL